MVLRLRALRPLLTEFARFAAARRSWWVVGFGVVALGAVALATAGGSAVPVAVYAFT